VAAQAPRIERPGIATAIPKRRYKVGGFTFVILGEIDSTDGRDYRWILAAVVEGRSEPGMYITAERLPQEAGGAGRYGVRLILPGGSRVLDRSDAYQDLDAFAGAAVDLARTVLNLGDEEVRRL
jgi:hypothetical protein